MLREALVADKEYPDGISDQLLRHIQNSLEDDMANVQQGGRVALITGASGGIASGVARLLATWGMRIVVNYRSSRDRADDVVASIRSAGGEAMAVQRTYATGPTCSAWLSRSGPPWAKWRFWSTAP
jgi:uncharacterized membrane protein